MLGEAIYFRLGAKEDTWNCKVGYFEGSRGPSGLGCPWAEAPNQSPFGRHPSDGVWWTVAYISLISMHSHDSAPAGEA